MSDVGEPTPMKREQDIRARLNGPVRDGDDYTWIQAMADMRWLLSELARLRTEAHQMQDGLSAPLSEVFEAEKAKVRDHIVRLWRDTGPNQKIKLNLPRWFWEMAMQATAGAPSEGLRPADEGENAEGLSVICRECGTLTAGVIAGNRVTWVTCAACLSRAGAVGPAGHGGG